MMFFGDFLCGNVMSVPCTPTNIDNIIKVELSNGVYDDFKITKDVESELSSAIEQDWDNDTILHSKFDGNTSAGNVNWSFDTVSHLLIKRRKVGEFKWITLDVHEIESIKDFNLKNIDITAIPNNEYEYAAVPIINGVEGFYSIDNVEVKIDSMMIGDRDEVWNTIFSDNYFDSNSVIPSNTVQTMYDKYPTIVRNSDANYEEISVNAQFFPLNEDKTDYDTSNKARIEYHNRAKEFLKNGNFKILKTMDGRVWLVDISNPPTDSGNGHYANRMLSFSCIEIGDVENEEDLWECGFIGAEEEWWNR